MKMKSAAVVAVILLFAVFSTSCGFQAVKYTVDMDTNPAKVSQLNTKTIMNKIKENLKIENDDDLAKLVLSEYNLPSGIASPFFIRFMRDGTIDDMYFEFTYKKNANAYDIYGCTYSKGQLFFEKKSEEKTDTSCTTLPIGDVLATFLTVKWDDALLERISDGSGYFYTEVLNQEQMTTTARTYSEFNILDTATASFAVNKGTNITELDTTDGDTKFAGRSIVLTLVNQAKLGDGFANQNEYVVLAEYVLCDKNFMK